MRPEIITFDCYGTLIDWNAGIAEAFASEARRQGVENVEEKELLAAYHDAEPRVQAEEYRTYREVLTLIEVEVASLLGWSLPVDSRGYLADSVPSWPPFPETNPALEQLVADGYELGILSNIDDDLLAGTRRQFTVGFDLLVTAQQMRSYKPAPAHFERALEEVGGEPARILHIAQSYFHDIRTAVSLGIPTVWVNRLAEDLPGDGSIPTAEVRDMKEAADWVRAN